jgi:hypothetical protein
LAPPLTFKTNKTMAIKKTTSVKKSDPPKKKPGQAPSAPRKFAPDRMLTGKDFGKIGRTDKDYFYQEGVAGGGQGGIKSSAPTGKNYTKSQGYFTTNVASGGSPVKGVFDPAKLRGYGVSYDKKGERTITNPRLMKEEGAMKAAKDRQKAKMKAAQMVQRQSASGKKTTVPAKKK